MVTGTAYVADSPRLFFELLEAFDEIGIKQMIAEYFGEAPVLSLAKTAHRRLPPDASGGWHQDAAVYGMAAHALDLWMPVSRCGDVAPGLALWPRRLDRVVDTVGPGATEFGTSPAALAALTRRRASRVPGVRARRRRDPRRADPPLDAVEPRASPSRGSGSSAGSSRPRRSPTRTSGCRSSTRPRTTSRQVQLPSSGAALERMLLDLLRRAFGRADHAGVVRLHRQDPPLPDPTAR